MYVSMHKFGLYQFLLTFLFLSSFVFNEFGVILAVDTDTDSSSDVDSNLQSVSDLEGDDDDEDASSVSGSRPLPKFDPVSCTIKVGSNEDEVINLKPLARRDGFPRYNSTFNVSVQEYQSSWNYSFNPCGPYSLPHNNPHAKEVFGDGCHSVVMCKYSCQESRCFYFSLGIHSEDKISVEPVIADNKTAEVVMVYTGIKSLRASNTKVRLICDRDRKGEDEGLFKIRVDNGFAELHHECCCVGGCWKKGLGQLSDVGVNNGTGGNNGKVGADGETMLVIVGTVVGLVMMVALIGGLCYVKRTHLQFYSKLPGVQPNGSGPNNRSGIPRGAYPATLLSSPSDSSKNSDFRDYEPSAVASARRKLIPVLTDCNIQLQSVEMGQRLGGGIFGDTHLAKWNEMTVTVKRLTLAIHGNQLTTETMDWMKDEVWFLSRQRHKNIVCVLGLCLEGRLPFLLTEYVIGECLKDYLTVNGQQLTWPQRIRMCCQVADGMAFLHSTKPPIIHRDLRCGNLFLSDSDLVKVADFGLIKLLQPMREQCNNDECSCQRQCCACPATLRWTAPEILTHLTTKEGESSIISTACDIYSFGLVMWELIFCRDPFDEITVEAEVIEIVRNGGRPDTPPTVDMMPHYKDLMKTAWDQRPTFRPAFKQVAVKLKELIGPARSHQKQLISLKQRQQKLQENVEPV